MQVKHIFIIQYSAEGHLGGFQVLAVTNKAAMNMVEHVSLWYGGVSPGCMYKGGIAGEETWLREAWFPPLRSETNREMSLVVAK